MDFGVFPFVIAGVLVVSVVTLLMIIVNRKDRLIKDSQKGGHGRAKSQNQIIREANRRLAKNPNDPEGLIALGEVYFNARLWQKAYDIYFKLSKIAVDNKLVDSFTSNLRAGLCAMELEKPQEAVAIMSSIYNLNPHNFDLNINLGKALYKSKLYDKAVPCLKKSIVINPEAEGAYYYLAQSYFYGKHYRDALPCYKKALDEQPNNKECLFNMAMAMVQENHADKAVKIFMHLRADSVYGPQSCLESGRFHSMVKQNDEAIQDFQIGLRHENVPPEIKVDLEYRLAQCYFTSGNIGDGLALLKQIKMTIPGYKDVESLIARYQELSQNSNLKIYLTGSQGDFVALCRKFVAVFYKGLHGNVKIQSIDSQPSYTDITAEVSTIKWEDVEIFRFFRSQTVIGEIYIRELHGHLQDIKADKGICVTAGVYSEEAQRFTEGRPLDLIDKMALIKVLKTIS